ncbi:MAG TPA: dihydroneopterin aldolase [Acidimicrobiales bacterium]|nr:dihydroneopterin aldolase [Acidimicrobiales bacterium]
MTEPSALPWDRIELRGLRVAARVGVLPIEREQDQPLEIDLDAVVDLAPAGASDDLADTVHYGAVCDAVVETVGAGHVALLERLAELVAQAVLSIDPRIVAVDLAVRKLRPPVPHDLATSGVHVVRTRR